jgi:competence protein ComEC
VVARLRALGVDTIDLLVASHNHADHIGGAPAVLSSFPVRYYLDNAYPATTLIQRRVLALVRRRGVTYLAPTARTISLGEATLRVIPPLPGVGGDGQNNRSVGILLERPRFRALMTGDSEVGLLEAWLASLDVPDVDVLKAAHHGARNGLTPAWLARTRPEVVVVSVGAGNQYGHPHAWALRHYGAGGRLVLRTDLDGEVLIAVAADGSYTVTSRRGAQTLGPDTAAARARTQRAPAR